MSPLVQNTAPCSTGSGRGIGLWPAAVGFRKELVSPVLGRRWIPDARVQRGTGIVAWCGWRRWGRFLNILLLHGERAIKSISGQAPELEAELDASWATAGAGGIMGPHGVEVGKFQPDVALISSARVGRPGASRRSRKSTGGSPAVALESVPEDLSAGVNPLQRFSDCAFMLGVFFADNIHAL